MNLDNSFKRFIKKEAEQVQKEREERELNPLSQYSTTQLKKELRRRKKEWN